MSAKSSLRRKVDRFCNAKAHSFNTVNTPEFVKAEERKKVRQLRKAAAALGLDVAITSKRRAA